jgi:hypothetical protein
MNLKRILTAPFRGVKKGLNHTMKNIILGILRHALTSAGGAIVATGYLTGGDYDSAVGALLTLVGIAWSVFEKRQAKITK